MKLTYEQIRNITQGAVDILESDGYLRFLRFTEQECALISNPNLYYPAGVQLVFRTDGTSLQLKGRTMEKSGIRSYFAFDIYENDSFLGAVTNLQDADAVRDYACSVYPLGEFSSVFPLHTGEKQIRIVLPHSVLAEISELTIENATYITPVRPTKTLVAYGDSITQGYDALHPSNTYAMRLANALGAELYNKSLGGACFSPAMAAASSGVQADLLLTAYGTNDWGCCDRETFTSNAAGFFENLVRQYPGVPIYTITPIWRKDHLEKVTSFGTFAEVEEVIRKICAPYPSIHIIDGIPLVPHDETYFGDLRLHPNDAGFAEYAAGCIAKIEQI